MSEKMLFQMLMHSDIVWIDSYLIEGIYPVIIVHGDLDGIQISKMISGTVEEFGEYYENYTGKKIKDIIPLASKPREFVNKKDFVSFAESNEVLKDYKFDWDRMPVLTFTRHSLW